MVGCYGCGHVALPGLLGRWALLEKDQRVGQAIHLGQVADVGRPCPAVLVADSQQVLHQRVDLGVGIGPDAEEDGEHITMEMSFYWGFSKNKVKRRYRAARSLRWRKERNVIGEVNVR